jgi:CHAT domain-containing protein
MEVVRRVAAAGILAFAGAVAASAQSPPPAPAAAMDLAPGQAVERELAVGGGQAYSIALQAGDFLHVEIRDKGPRTLVSLLDAGGTEVARRDSSDGVTAYRLLAVVAEPGTYTLEVRLFGQDGPGRHVVRVEPPHPATGQERVLAAADDALAGATRLAAEGTADSRKQALARLDAAEAGFRDAADRRGEALALRERGTLQDALGLADAGASFERALGLFREIGDREGEASALNGLARILYFKGDRAAALRLHELAAERAAAVGDLRMLAHSLVSAGLVLDHSGWSEKAIERYQRALDAAARAGHRRAEARAVNNLGVAYQNLGERQRSLEYYERAVLLQRAARSRLGEVIALGNVSNMQAALKDYPRALAVFEEALALAKSAELPMEEAWLLKNASKVHSALGDHARAVEAGRQALELARAGNERETEGEALFSLGRALHAAGENEAAAETLHQAVGVAAAIGEPFLEAEALQSLARAERDRGRLDEAVQHAQRCIRLTEALRVAMTNPELRGSFQAAEEGKYGVLIDLLMSLHEKQPGAGHDAAALRVSEQARGRLLLDALIEARADVREGVDAELLDRERALQKRLSEAGATTTAGEALTRQYGELQALIRRASPRYAALTQPAPASAEDIRGRLLDGQTVLIEYYLGEKRSFLWAVTPDALVSQSLPGRAELEAAARRVHELLTARQRSVNPAAAREADGRLDAEARALREALLAAIGPRLDTEWKGKRLLIITSGALAYLPFGALPSPAGRPLVADHEIVYAPSASVLIALQEGEAGRPPASGLAVLADPVFEATDPRVAGRPGSTRAAELDRESTPVGLTRAMDSAGGRFARLPFSRFEAREIAKLAPRASLLSATDFDASRPLVAEGALRGRRVIHFATHGLLNTEHPDLSGLVLSLVDRSGAAQDGFLRMAEIYNLKLPADLVVLSACQTALGREIRGEGLMGLTRGFLYAGARAVVASLWQVDDESTAELMKRFYRGMLKEGRRPADALRAAQLEMSRTKRWSAPFYWAGFVLQGDWR